MISVSFFLSRKTLGVATPLGDGASFGSHLLEHWEEKGKDVAKRLQFLAAAEDAIAFPHEI